LNRGLFDDKLLSED